MKLQCQACMLFRPLNVLTMLGINGPRGRAELLICDHCFEHRHPELVRAAVRVGIPEDEI